VLNKQECPAYVVKCCTVLSYYVSDINKANITEKPYETAIPVWYQSESNEYWNITWST